MAYETENPKPRNAKKPAPDALPPVASVIDSLTAEDQLLLTYLLSVHAEFVDHEDFAKRDFDTVLFGVEAKPIAKNATRFIRPKPAISEEKCRGSRLPTLSTEQEQRLFLRFNYARREVKKILDAASKAQHDSDATVVPERPPTR